MSYLTLIGDDGDDDLEIQPLCKENSNSNQIKSNQIKSKFSIYIPCWPKTRILGLFCCFSDINAQLK